MRRLVLHIGSHKTGTTSIQRFLDVAGDEVFARTGLRYVPLQRRTIAPIDPRAGDPETLRRAGAIARDEYLEHVCRGDADRLVVEEDLSWVFEPSQIDAMLGRLHAGFGDIRIIAYVRRQDQHLVSHYQQGSRFPLTTAVFYGSQPTAIPAHAAHHDRYLDYHARLLPYVEQLGTDRVTVRVFDRERLEGGDVVTDFLALLGVDRARSAIDPDSFDNESFGKTTAKLGHLYNLIPDRQIPSKRIAKFVPDDPKLTIARRDAMAIVGRYADSNRHLATLFGSSQPVFSSDFSGYPDDATSDWNADEVALALGGLRRLMRARAKWSGIDVEAAPVLPEAVRALRRQAQRGTIPSEDEVNDLLLLVLARLNAIELGRQDRADAAPIRSI